MNVTKQARLAGALYLTVGIFGGFAMGYVVPLGASAGTELVRWGVLADFVQLGAFLGLVAVLRTVLGASTSAWGELMTAAVTASVALMAAADAAALAAAFDLRSSLVTAAQVFFGLWLIPLGVLGWKSRRFPRWLAVLLVAGAFAYGLDVMIALFDGPLWLHGPLSFVPAVAEIATVFFLLIVGVQKKESDLV